MTTLLLCAFATAAVAGARGTWSPCGLSMTSAINPLSESARGHRYPATCAWFVAGALVGGLALGAAAALPALLLGALTATTALALAAAAAVLTLCCDLRVLGLSLPVHPRQVDEAWFGQYRRWVYAAGFGLQIGAGLATYVMTAATYLLVALAALTGSPAQALLVGATFGLVRGAAAVLSARVRTPQDLRRLHERLESLAPWSWRAALATQAGVALVLAAPAGGPLAVLAVASVVAGAAGLSQPAERSPSGALVGRA